MNGPEVNRLDTLNQAPNSSRLVVSLDAIRALPATFAKQHRVLPLKIQNGVIHIASVAPGNERVIDDIRLVDRVGG